MSVMVYKSSEQRQLRRVVPDLIRSRELLIDLVWKDLRGRYRYAVLGFLWAVIEPLALMLVLTFVFTYVFQAKVESGLPNPPPYPVMLLCGLIFWQYFAAALNGAAQSLLSNQHLVTKVHFARETVPIAAVLFPLVNLLIGFVLLLAVHVLLHGSLGIWLLWMAPIFAIQLALTVGLGLLVACGNVLYRDVGNLVAVGLTFGFYATPVFYDLSFVRGSERFAEWMQWLYMLNPMVELITAYREVLFEARHHEWVLLAWPAVCAVVTLVAGAAFFRRYSPSFSDYL